MGYIIAYFVGIGCGCFVPFVIAGAMQPGPGKFEKKKHHPGDRYTGW